MLFCCRVNLPVFRRRQHVSVGRVVLGGDIAARHTVPAIVACRTIPARFGKRGLANVDDINPKLARALLNEKIGTLQRRRRKENTVGQIFEMIEISADTHLALDAVIVRRDIGVIERPVFSGPVVLAAFKIALAESKRHGVPQLRFAAQAAAALAIVAGLAGLHDGNMAERKLEGQRVRIEISARVDLRPAFEHQGIDAEAG